MNNSNWTIEQLELNAKELKDATYFQNSNFMLKRIADLLVAISADIVQMTEKLEDINDRVQTIEIRGR